MRQFDEIKKYLGSVAEKKEGIFFYLPEITKFQKNEIAFHNAICQEEEDAHQLQSLRNRYYHEYFAQWLYKLPQHSIILEVGTGSGFDLLKIAKKNYCIVASDISQKSINAVKNKAIAENLDGNIIFLASDGQKLPFLDNIFDTSFLVATLHHFENQAQALKEINRVTKKGGLIIAAMEPSVFMMKFTKLFKHVRSLRIHNISSEADETHSGYSLGGLKKIAASCGIKIEMAKRVWLLQGLMHYGLEAAYRFFKLKKRIRAPFFIEYIILVLDEILLQIPLVRNLNWHWIVIFRKGR